MNRFPKSALVQVIPSIGGTICRRKPVFWRGWNHHFSCLSGTTFMAFSRRSLAPSSLNGGTVKPPSNRTWTICRFTAKRRTGRPFVSKVLRISGALLPNFWSIFRWIYLNSARSMWHGQKMVSDGVWGYECDIQSSWINESKSWFSYFIYPLVN